MTIATLFPFLLGSLILLYSASLACKYRPHGLLPVATLCLCLFCGLVALLSAHPSTPLVGAAEVALPTMVLVCCRQELRAAYFARKADARRRGRVVHLPRRREKEEQSGLAHMPRESRAGNERRACS
ncbi:MAG TPA: hypothetical protein IAA58_07905 [Candidatus Gallacutalibacter stercoravium]|nr:hypothetical protein [Candidatus Gallacutalibacter stercoravium]